MTVQQAILDRRSTRGFDPIPLTEEELNTLKEAALASPSARNDQPWHFTFVRNKALLDRFDEAGRAYLSKNAPESVRARFSDPSYRLSMGAPLFVIISIAKENEGFFPPIDCGIAVENLALSAWGMGLGSVIVGMPKDTLNAPENADLAKAMGIPEGNRFMIGIVIGHNNVTKEAHPILRDCVTIV